jgi:hypothetical protein
MYRAGAAVQHSVEGWVLRLPGPFEVVFNLSDAQPYGIGVFSGLSHAPSCVFAPRIYLRQLTAIIRNCGNDREATTPVRIPCTICCTCTSLTHIQRTAEAFPYFVCDFFASASTIYLRSLLLMHIGSEGVLRSITTIPLGRMRQLSLCVVIIVLITILKATNAQTTSVDDDDRGIAAW